MRLSTLLGGLLLGSVAVAQLDECADDDSDELAQCFTSSLVQASAFCTQSIVPQTAGTVTVTPTIMTTDFVTSTTLKSASTTVYSRTYIYIKKKKRGLCTPKSSAPAPTFACLQSMTALAPIEPSRFTSACACLGLTAATETATAAPAIVTTTATVVSSKTTVATLTRTQTYVVFT